MNNSMEVDDSDGSSNHSRGERYEQRYFFNIIESDDLEKIKSLLSQSIYAQLINAQDGHNKHNTALHMVINRRRKKRVDKVINKNIIDLLISKKPDVTIENSENKTVLDLINDLIQKEPSDEDLKFIKQSIRRLDLKRPSSSDDGTDPKKPYIESRIDQKWDRKSYPASGVKRALDGIIYQAKLLGLFAKTGKDKYYDFRLATEMDSAAKFDDVVFTYRHENKLITRFLQAKHKQEPDKNPITLTDLYSDSDKNPFSLQKYLISFCKIMEEPDFKDNEKADFTIITNTHFAFSGRKSNELKNMFMTETLKNDDILNIDCEKFTAERYRLNEKEKEKLIAKLKSNLLKIARESKINSSKQSIMKSLDKICASITNKRINSSEQSLNDASQELERRKVRKSYFKKYIQEYFGCFEKILENKDRENLRKIIDELKDESTKKKKSRSDKKQYKGKCNEILKRCRELHTQETKKIEKVISEIVDRTELKKNIKYLEVTKKKLSSISDITTTDSIDEIKDKIKQLDSEIMQTFRVSKKIAPIDELQEIRNKSDKLISEISATLLILNDTINEKAEEFIKKFRIVVGYPNEEELSVIIEKKLGNDFKLLKSDFLIDSFEKEMLQFLKDYSKGCARDYTWKSCDIFFKKLKKNIRILNTSGLSMIYPEELRSYKIVVEEHLKTLKDFLNHDKQISLINTKYSLLSAIKVLQTLKSAGFKKNFEYLGKNDGFIFLPLKMLLLPTIQKFVLECFSEAGTHHLLVIDFQTSTKPEHLKKDVAETTNKLKIALLQSLQSATDNKNKKIIIIGLSKEIPTNHLNNLNLFPIEDEGIRFEDLTHESQKNMLQRKILFQGKTRRLEQIIDKSLARIIVDQESLIKLVGETKIRIGDEKAFKTIGYEKDYYIDRRLHRQKIKMEYFKKHIAKYFKKCWIFLITGATKYELNKLDIEKNVFKLDEIQNWNKQHKGFILPPSAKDDFYYETIFNWLYTVCTKAKSIHWLEYRSGDLFWREFKGNISDSDFADKCIEQSYVPIENDIKPKEHIFEEDFFTNPESLKPKVIILANDSGMGKSIALTSISRKIVNFVDGDESVNSEIDTNDDFSNLWIIRIDLIDHAKQDTEDKESSLATISESANNDEYADFLSKMAFPGSKSNVDIRLQRELFKAVLLHSTKDRKQPNILIQFDGFDEICCLSTPKVKFKYRENTIALLRTLNKNFNVIQFWVTTRLHEKVDLQRELETPALVLCPLTRAEQETFSNKFWKWNLHFFKNKKTGIKVACQHLIKRLTNLQSSLNQLYPGNLNDSIHKAELNETITKALTSLNSFTRPRKTDLNKVTEDIKNMDFSQYTTLLLGKLDKEFTNVPLHLQMLVEVIFEKKINFNENFGLLDLYEGFVEMKLTRHIERNNKIKEKQAIQAKPFKKRFEDLLEDHINLAENLYERTFKEENELDTKIATKSSKNKIQVDDAAYLTKPGLVKYNDDGTLEFVRPTYAEYFFTLYLVKNLRLLKVQKLLLNEVLLRKSYQPVRQLLNGHLKILFNYKKSKEMLKNEQKDQTILRIKLSEIKGHELDHLLNVKFRFAKQKTIQVVKDESKPQRTILHVMVEENLVATIRYLFDKLKHEIDILKTAFQLAKENGSEELIRVLRKCMKPHFTKEETKLLIHSNASIKDKQTPKSIPNVNEQSKKTCEFNSDRSSKNVKKMKFDTFERNFNGINSETQLTSSPKLPPLTIKPIQSLKKMRQTIDKKSHKRVFQLAKENGSGELKSIPNVNEQSKKTCEFNSDRSSKNVGKMKFDTCERYFNGINSETQLTSSPKLPPLTIKPIQSPKANLPLIIRTPMVNLGNTCFMASVLQVLFHLPAFTKDLIDFNKHDRFCPCTMCILKKTFIETDPTSTNRVPYKPNAIKEHLTQVSENFNINQQQDSHEFFNCLFRKIVSDLKQKNDDSDAIFYVKWRGEINSWIKCQGKCNNDIPKKKIVLYNGFLLDINHVETLNDALDAYFNEEQEQASTCVNCDTYTTNNIKYIRIIEGPKLLNITFKRFAGNGTKISKSIQFDGKHLLNLTKWHENQQSLQYRFIGAITHTGDSVNSGHYYAVVSGGDGKYFKFDDENPVEEYNLEESTNAYMLFFEKVVDDNNP